MCTGRPEVYAAVRRRALWEEGWGVKAGGGVLGTHTDGLAQRVLLVGQTLGGGLKGEILLVDMASVQGRACFLEKREEGLGHLFKAS